MADGQHMFPAAQALGGPVSRIDAADRLDRIVVVDALIPLDGFIDTTKGTEQSFSRSISAFQDPPRVVDGHRDQDQRVVELQAVVERAETLERGFVAVPKKSLEPRVGRQRDGESFGDGIPALVARDVQNLERGVVCQCADTGDEEVFMEGHLGGAETELLHLWRTGCHRRWVSRTLRTNGLLLQQSGNGSGSSRNGGLVPKRLVQTTARGVTFDR